MIYDLVVIGAGAGGVYSAIRLAEFHRGAKICILEAAKKPLSKVEISGGGRCNVTHACFKPDLLATYYPRGHQMLADVFREFQPSDLIRWFKEKGVALKTEDDGRVFPVSDSSATIINCFLRELNNHHIDLLLSTRATEWEFIDQDELWEVQLFDSRKLKTNSLLVASGSDKRIWDQIGSMGYKIIPPVPSLFTFNILDKNLHALMGISKEHVQLSIPSIKMQSEGPLLITHWGMSGPAILKLSAWGARELYECGYVFDLKVNWLGHQKIEQFIASLEEVIREHPKKYIHKLIFQNFPSRLWQYLCERAQITAFTSGAEFGRKQVRRLTDVLTGDVYRVTGKSTYKEEFVTAGGVDLSEIDMDTFQSKKHPGLYMAGEVLNIDAVTGGFNFQAAWTAAHIVAKTISQKLK